MGAGRGVGARRAHGKGDGCAEAGRGGAGSVHGLRGGRRAGWMGGWAGESAWIEGEMEAVREAEGDSKLESCMRSAFRTSSFPHPIPLPPFAHERGWTRTVDVKRKEGRVSNPSPTFESDICLLAFQAAASLPPSQALTSGEGGVRRPHCWPGGPVPHGCACVRACVRELVSPCLPTCLLAYFPTCLPHLPVLFPPFSPLTLSSPPSMVVPTHPSGAIDP